VSLRAVLLKEETNTLLQEKTTALFSGI